MKPVQAAPAPAPAGPDRAAPLSASPGPQALVESILRRVHEERAAIGGFLGQAAWIQVAEDALQIAYLEKQAYFRDKVQSREVVEYLRRVAREVAGRDLRVQVETATPGSFGTETMRPIPPASDAPAAAPRGASAAPAGTAKQAASAASVPAAGGGGSARPVLDEPARRALVDKAMREPTVRSLLDVLGGEIVDIEPA
jgi:hypothetical protein